MHDQLMPPCPVCGEPSRLQFTKGGGWPYYSCDSHRIQAILLAIHARKAEKKDDARFTLSELLIAGAVAMMAGMIFLGLLFFLAKTLELIS